MRAVGLERCRNSLGHFFRHEIVWGESPMRRPRNIGEFQITRTSFLRFSAESSVEHSERLHDKLMKVVPGGELVQVESHVQPSGGGSEVGLIEQRR